MHIPLSMVSGKYSCLVLQGAALREAEDATAPAPAAPPPPAPLRPVSNGSTPGPLPEKAAPWSPPPLPSIGDVVNHKLRPVALSHRGHLGLGSTSDNVTDGRDSLLKELASLQLRSRSASTGRSMQVGTPLR